MKWSKWYEWSPNDDRANRPTPRGKGLLERDLSRKELAFGCLALVLIVGLGYVFVVAPVLQRQGQQLQIMQTAFDALPVYPGSTRATFNATNEWGHEVDIVAGYRYSGFCTSLQSYYNSQAPKEGWSVTKPLYIVSGDEYHTDYQKPVSGLRLDLNVSCSVHQDGPNAGDPQDIYVLYIAQAS